MTPDEFLKSRLKGITDYELTDSEKRMLELGQLKLYLTKKVLSKKFRQNKLKDETQKIIADKISMVVDKNKPLHFIFGFGGYKNHNISEHHPEIGWAEVFMILYTCEILAPLLVAYEPGVHFQFESEAAAVIMHDNYTQEDVDAYMASFNRLLEFVKPHIAANLKFSYITLPEQYDTIAFFKRIEPLVKKKAEELHKDTSSEEIKRSLRRSLFNLKRKGKKDLTKLSEEELNSVALYSLAYDIVFLEEDYGMREDFFNGEERIMTIGTYCSEEENPDNWITLNSCRRSPNAFWTSRGVLVQEGDTYFEDIIGPERYKAIKDQVVKESSNLLEKVADGLKEVTVLKK